MTLLKIFQVLLGWALALSVLQIYSSSKTIRNREKEPDLTTKPGLMMRPTRWSMLACLAPGGPPQCLLPHPSHPKPNSQNEPKWVQADDAELTPSQFSCMGVDDSGDKEVKRVCRLLQFLLVPLVPLLPTFPYLGPVYDWHLYIGCTFKICFSLGWCLTGSCPLFVSYTVCILFIKPCMDIKLVTSWYFTWTQCFFPT